MLCNLHHSLVFFIPDTHEGKGNPPPQTLPQYPYANEHLVLSFRSHKMYDDTQHRPTLVVGPQGHIFPSTPEDSVWIACCPGARVLRKKTRKPSYAPLRWFGQIVAPMHYRRCRQKSGKFKPNRIGFLLLAALVFVKLTKTDHTTTRTPTPDRHVCTFMSTKRRTWQSQEEARTLFSPIKPVLSAAPRRERENAKGPPFKGKLRAAVRPQQPWYLSLQHPRHQRHGNLQMKSGVFDDEEDTTGTRNALRYVQDSRVLGFQGGV